MIKRLMVPVLTTGLLLAGCHDRSGGDKDGMAANQQQSAAAGTSLPSCFEMVDTGRDGKPGLKPLKPQRELFILIDKTTAFDDRLIDHMKEVATDYLGSEPAAVKVASFSALTADEYATFEYSGEAERHPTEKQKDATPMRKFETLERCLAEQSGVLSQQVAAAVDTVASRSSGTYANSEVMGSLAQFAEAVRKSPARDRMVLVASDMLEHSSATSFYQNQQIRQFDWEEELQKAANNGLLADFGGARVAVIGAGMLPPEAEKQATRDTAALRNLRTFWENWFRNSEAELDSSHYGQPDLMVGL